MLQPAGLEKHRVESAEEHAAKLAAFYTTGHTTTAQEVTAAEAVRQAQATWATEEELGDWLAAQAEARTTLTTPQRNTPPAVVPPCATSSLVSQVTAT